MRSLSDVSCLDINALDTILLSLPKALRITALQEESQRASVSSLFDPFLEGIQDFPWHLLTSQSASCRQEQNLVHTNSLGLISVTDYSVKLIIFLCHAAALAIGRRPKSSRGQTVPVGTMMARHCAAPGDPMPTPR
ncbi:hypothetical protein QQF64_021257 [Cirrhinus molitorella]|uniref:Uncharacterized protein n=1 Tax=Cirrhinus molitorella TaxID=172907 RepID=A0ABR3LBK0_9TELE